MLVAHVQSVESGCHLLFGADDKSLCSPLSRFVRVSSSCVFSPASFCSCSCFLVSLSVLLSAFFFFPFLSFFFLLSLLRDLPSPPSVSLSLALLWTCRCPRYFLRCLLPLSFRRCRTPGLHFLCRCSVRSFCVSPSLSPSPTCLCSYACLPSSPPLLPFSLSPVLLPIRLHLSWHHAGHASNLLNLTFGC